MKSSFSEQIYRLLKTVPRGKITTYKELANALNTKAYRAVGSAMRKNPYAYTISPEAIRNRRSVLRGDSKRTSGFFLVPCHRVIKTNGEVGNFTGGGIKKKIELLRQEGVEVKDNKIDLKKFLYKFR